MTVYLPKEKILFASDSIYPTKNTPVLFMGDPDNWVKSLERLLSLEIKVLLPGHGLIPKDPHAEIKQHIEKLTDIKNRTIAAIRKSDKPIAFSELEKHADFLKGRDLQGVVRALVKRGIIEADSEDITRANLRLKS